MHRSIHIPRFLGILFLLSSLCLAVPGRAQTIALTPGDDLYINDATIDNLLGLAGNDTLINNGIVNNFIHGGDGNDIITNNGMAMGIIGGLGDDTITNNMIAIVIIGAYGNNVITNNGMSLLTIGGYGDDIITNNGIAYLLVGGPGDDTIINNGEALYMGGGLGNDILTNSETGWIGVMLGRGGDDIITNAGLVMLGIDGEEGNDTIRNTATGIVEGDIYGWYGNDTLINEGTIWGVMAGEDGADTLINSGTVGMSILGGLGNDTVRILPGSLVYGMINGGPGWDLLSIEAAGNHYPIQYINFEDLTLVPDGTAYLLGEWLYPEGTVRVEGGTVVIPDLLTALDLIIDAAGKLHIDGTARADQSTNYGRLWINGELHGAVTNFGFMGGTGTIFGDLTNNGRIAPGNSIGTLTIDGNYRHGAKATYEAELAANGTSDLLRISGRATLDGGTVSARLPRRLYPDGFDWTILTAESGIDGRFGNVSQPASAVLSLDLTYGAREVRLTVDRASYGTFGSTANQQSLGAALDTLVPLASGSNGSLEAFLTTLDFDYSAGQLESMLASLNPEAYTHLTAAQGDSLRRFGRRLSGRTTQLATAPEENAPLWSLWGYAYADRTDLEATNEYLGHAARRLGGILGADRRLFQNASVGFALATETADIDSSLADTSGDQDGFLAGIYGRTAFNRFFTEGLVAYGRYDNTLTRPIAFDGYDTTVGGGFDGNTWLAKISGGYDFALGTWTLSPLASLGYLSSRSDGFRESGNDFLNLLVERTDDDRLFSCLGAKAASAFKVGQVTLLPQFFLAWQHDFEGPTSDLQAAFEANPQALFSITGNTYAEDLLITEASLTAAWGNRWHAYAALSGNWGEDWRACGIAAGMVWRF